MIIDLPIGRQTFDFDCGVKALQIVMAYYGVDVREDELMKDLKVSKKGVSVQNMISVAGQKGFQVEAKSGFTLETLKRYLDEKHPVIVLVQAWAERFMTLEDWKRNNENGHYVVVIGYEGSILVFEDPASFRRTWLTEEEFLARWHDIDPRTKKRLEHFAMVLLGKPPAKKVLEHMG